MQGKRPRALVRRILAATVVAAMLSLSVPVASFAAPPVPSDPRPHAADRFLVKFAPDSSALGVGLLNVVEGSRQVGGISKLGIKVMSVPQGKSAEEMAADYSRNPNVAFAEPDYRVQATSVPNDPYYANEWGMPKISAPTAWDTTTGSSATTIAIVDTGVDSTQPDLYGRVVAGYDYVNSDSDPTDDNGHGTMCAGVIGANGNNSVGVAGMDWHARLLAVKVLDSTGSGYMSNVANGITYAADHGARVISMSLGGSTGSSTLQTAVDYAYSKGAFMAAASGNDSAGSVSYPAAYDHVMAVGATDSNDALASFSNYGAGQEIAAPGVNIATTKMGGGYMYFSGTSAATPFVAGLAGLVLAKNPALTPDGVYSAIRSGAIDLGATGWDSTFGYGRIDAARTLAAVAAPAPDPTPAPTPTPTPTADTVAPTVAITSPASGATVSRSVTVQVSASDNVGVAKVNLLIDGVVVATDTSAPFAFTWDTTRSLNGSHQLVAVAYDAAGNSATSTAVNVSVYNRVSKKK